MRASRQLACLFAIGVSLAANAAIADTISLNFSPNGAVIGSTTSAGVVSVANWSDSATNDNSNPSGDNLMDSSGSPTTLDYAAAGFDTNYYTNAGNTTGDLILQKDYLDNTNGTATVTLSEIPYASYDVYVYFGSDAGGRTGTISDGATTYYFLTQGNDNFAYTQTTDTDPAGTNPAANYAIFAGLSGASQTLTVTRGTGNSGLFGLQVVEVPEPGALSLTAIGLLGLVRRRRKRA